MYKYNPQINYQRHKPYASAFDGVTTIYKYLDLIKKFVLDSNISPHNEDDLQFLRDLLFETKFGKNHIYFYDYFCRSKNRNKQNIKMLSRYADFLSTMSDLFLEDMYHHFLKTRDKYLINNYFSYLSTKNKLKFLQISKDYSFTVKKIPRISTYMTFL